MKTIILDDGIEYIIYDTELINNIEYTLFVNINDDTDICFRKTITENDKNTIKQSEKVNVIIKLFCSKNILNHSPSSNCHINNTNTCY